MSRLHRIVVAETREQARAHRVAWTRLLERRLEDNLFLRPEFLLPLLEHDADDSPFCLPFVYDTRDELIGVALFGRPDSRGVGRGMVSTWEHPLVFDTTPLLDRHRAGEAARALWDWLSGGDRSWSFVRWARTRLDSRAWSHLAAAIDADGARWWIRRVFRRAALEVPDSWGDYLEGLSRSQRKRVRRIERKLAESGAVRVRITEHPDAAVDRFLAMEAAGWKGDAGTALACDPRQEGFFRAATAALAESRAAYFVELLLDERPIAITPNFIDGDTLYAYKTAYDPEFAGLSPGVAVELELVRTLVGRGRVRVIDSCASGDSHVSGLWRQRRTIGEILVATDALSAVSLAAAPHVRRSRRLARDVWRTLRREAG